MRLDVPRDGIAAQTGFGADADHEAEPGRAAVGRGLGENDLLRSRAVCQRVVQTLPVVAAALDEGREFFELLAADGRLHIGHLQIVAEVAVNVLVVVAPGQLPELTVKAVSATVVVSAGANAVPSPIAEAEDQAVQQGIVGIDAAALAHGHVVRRVEAAGADVPPRARVAGLAVNGVLAAQRIAVVLHQPQPVLPAKFPDRFQVKGIAQTVRDHHGLGLRA